MTVAESSRVSRFLLELATRQSGYQAQLVNGTSAIGGGGMSRGSGEEKECWRREKGQSNVD